MLQPLDTDKTLRLIRARFPPPRGWIAVAEIGLPYRPAGFTATDVDGQTVELQRGVQRDWAWLIRHHSGRFASLLRTGAVQSVDQRKAAAALALLETPHDSGGT